MVTELAAITDDPALTWAVVVTFAVGYALWVWWIARRLRRDWEQFRNGTGRYRRDDGNAPPTPQ